MSISQLMAYRMETFRWRLIERILLFQDLRKFINNNRNRLYDIRVIITDKTAFIIKNFQ